MISVIDEEVRDNAHCGEQAVYSVIDDEINCICKNCEYKNCPDLREAEKTPQYCPIYVGKLKVLERVRKRVQDRQKELWIKIETLRKKEPNNIKHLFKGSDIHLWNERILELIEIAGEEEKK